MKFGVRYHWQIGSTMQCDNGKSKIAWEVLQAETPMSCHKLNLAHEGIHHQATKLNEITKLNLVYNKCNILKF